MFDRSPNQLLARILSAEGLSPPDRAQGERYLAGSRFGGTSYIILPYMPASI